MMATELESRQRRLSGIVDDAAFLSQWRDTLAWLASARPGFEALLEGADGARYRGAFAPFQRRYLTLEENAVAARLMALSRVGEPTLARLLEVPFARKTYDRVAEALELVDFGRCRTFVNVGCGPFPAAALLIHERTDVPRIVAVDHEAVAVVLASQVIRGIAGPRLEVVEGDGATLDYGEADVIYVANHVFPKHKVVARIAATAAPHAKILVREPCGLGLMLAERGCDPLPPPLRRVVEGADDANFYSKHVLCALADGGSDGRE